MRWPMPGEKLGEARITSKGQVRIQRLLGVGRGDYLIFYQEGSRIYVVGGTVRPKR